MNSIIIYRILVFFLISSFCGSAFAQNSNIASNEDAFRAHLESKGVIKSQPIKGDLLTYSLINAVSLKRCGNLGVRDSPEWVSESDISIYRIDFDKEPSLICQDSPSPEACHAISRNCLAYGRALFCDIAYLERLRRIAEATYFTRFRRIARVHDGITENMFENISPFVMRDIALYEQLLSNHSANNVTAGQNIEDIEHLFNCTSDQSSTRLVPFITASILLGHEIAHVVEFACPASKDINDLAQTMRDSYKTVTCQEIAWTEILADVRSMKFIELPMLIAESVDEELVLLDMHEPDQICDKNILASLGISMSGAEFAKSQLKNENLALIIMTVANLVEYELAAFGSPSSALDAYETAITFQRKKATSLEVNEYFVNHARNNLTASNFNGNTHGLPALRGMGLLVGVNFPEFWHQCEQYSITNSVLARLSGLIAGQIAQGNILGCGNAEAEALNMGWSMVGIMLSPVQENLNPNNIIEYVKPLNSGILLRSLPNENLTEKAVIALVNKFDFFTRSWSNIIDAWDNPNGIGIKNQFEVIAKGNIIYDRSTNLMWQQSGSSLQLNQREMEDYIAALNSTKFGGYDNWRLPTLEEATSLIKSKQIDASQSTGLLYIDRIFDHKQKYIYTSDFWKGHNFQRWYVYFNIGNVGHSHFSENSRYAYIRAVRSAK